MLEMENIESHNDQSCVPNNGYPFSDPSSLGSLIEAENESSEIIIEANVDFDHSDTIKAPANCFLLYRSNVLKEITARYPGHSSRSVTSIIAENWKNEPLTVKNHFKEMAAREKAQFKKRFPEYRRVVKPKVRKRSESFKKTSPISVQGECSIGCLISDQFCYDNALGGRKRSYSMPEIPDPFSQKLRQRRSSFAHTLDSPLGLLLPVTHFNSYKNTCLAQALGRMN